VSTKKLLSPVVILPTLGEPHVVDMVESIDIDVRLLVIDNSAGVADWTWLPEDAWLLQPPTNLGYPASVNLGIKCYPAEPFWVVVNDDVVLAPGDLQRLVEADGYGWVGINDWSVSKLTADTVERVGWLDEGFHPAYCEDADLERRCTLAGIRWGFIKGDTTHAGSAALRLHRTDNARTYPRNVELYQHKWNTGVRGGGGYATPYDRPALPPSPALSRLRSQRWRTDR
jgi:GT2 family glycosyltransferase